MFKILKSISCKINICCNSKCSMNEKDNLEYIKKNNKNNISSI